MRIVRPSEDIQAPPLAAPSHPSSTQPMAAMDAPLATKPLNVEVRDALRASFQQAVAQGEAIPLLLHHCLLGCLLLPLLWLSLSHSRRPWLYQARWPLMASISLFNASLARYASSTNMFFAYFTGVITTWGTICIMNLVLWRRPQLEAARTLLLLPPGSDSKPPRVPNRVHPPSLSPATTERTTERPSRSPTTPTPGLEMLSHDDQAACIWQPFPADASFTYRLGWALDLILSFRFSGWNWAISSIPRPQIPHRIRAGDPVRIDSISPLSARGFSCCLSSRQLVRRRLATFLANYLCLDLLIVVMVKDPYFVSGPDNHYPLPPHLRPLPPWLLLAYRQLATLVAIFTALQYVFAFSDLAQHCFLSSVFPARAAPWQFASAFGSFSNVLDHGLAGWWGGWWHQTFRFQFLAPSAYLMRRGHLGKSTPSANAVAIFLSFFQSGLLHAAGSLSSIPPTKPWRAMLFFLLQPVGILAQNCISKVSRRCYPHPPPTVARAATLLTTMLWLYWTAGFVVDDFASTGLWLSEPVPFSPSRWLGLGHPADRWWRWDREHWPKWHRGKYWWDTGIAI